MKYGAVLLASVLMTPALFAADAAKTQAALQNYSQNVFILYSEAQRTVTNLQTAVNQLVANPSAETLEGAKKAWLDSRTIWGQTEAFRFYEGPIDDATYGVEGQINAWPLDEAYIDYVVGSPNAGIINNAAQYPTINEDVLIGLNENGSETNISTGFHAIEFLLWGQDLSATGPGARPYTDYVIGTGTNAVRRAAYLQSATRLLLKNISTVQNAWNPADSKSYGVEFSKQNSNEALTKVFKGLSSLLTDELAGERMYVGYESQSQEDEHSCFSDNTNVDIIENIQGVINVWTGDFNGKQGVGLDELVSPSVARRVTRELNAALAAAVALPRPYDSLLIAPEGSEERKVFLDTILSVQDAGTAVKDAAESIGLSIPTN